MRGPVDLRVQTEAGYDSRSICCGRLRDMMDLLAYIDPGAGSLFVQAVIATALVVPFFLRSQIRKGIARLRGRPSTATATTAPPSDDEVPPAQP